MSDLKRNEALIRSAGLVGQSDAMAIVADKILQCRRCLRRVLVIGEVGTERDQIAHALFGERFVRPGGVRTIEATAYSDNHEGFMRNFFGGDGFS